MTSIVARDIRISDKRFKVEVVVHKRSQIPLIKKPGLGRCWLQGYSMFKKQAVVYAYTFFNSDLLLL